MEIVLIACLKYRGKLPMLHDSPRREPGTRRATQQVPDATAVGIRRIGCRLAADERKFLRTLKKA
jgi:hypothetical protein